MKNIILESPKIAVEADTEKIARMIIETIDGNIKDIIVFVDNFFNNNVRMVLNLRCKYPR